MKRILPAALAALLLLLGACQPSVTESPAPSDGAVPPVTSPEGPDNTPVLTMPDESGRFVFANGIFLGALPGQRLSAHDTDFTMGELFNRGYYDADGTPLNTVLIFIGDGPGAFDDPEQAAALLTPYGTVVDGDYLELPLPAGLEGDAAAVPVPRYSFWAYFDGEARSLVSDHVLEQRAITGVDAHLSDERVTEALASVDITCDLSRMDRAAYTCDVDGDGQAETLELIQNPIDDSGYAILEEGDPIFYALLLADGDDLTVVASHHIDYTDDVTALFRAVLQNVCDLNDDGSCEIILQQMEWEWGHYAAFSLWEEQWTECLRGEYGI